MATFCCRMEVAPLLDANHVPRAIPIITHSRASLRPVSKTCRHFTHEECARELSRCPICQVPARQRMKSSVVPDMSVCARVCVYVYLCLFLCFRVALLFSSCGLHHLLLKTTCPLTCCSLQRLLQSRTPPLPPVRPHGPSLRCSSARVSSAWGLQQNAAA